MLARDAGNVEALERRLCGRARSIVCFSQEDREALGLAGDDRAFVAPLSMPDPPAAEGLRFPAFDVGMLGQWTEPGERDRLEWFLQRVVSKMHRHMMIAVAGRLPKRFPTRDKRVFFLGEVDDRTEFLRQCRVVALPERSRSGVSLGAVEAFELGLPAVATEEALRGIDETPVNVRRVDGANTFAKAVEEMALEQRTGGLEDCDGTAFRAGRMARLDAVLAEALASLSAG